MEAAGCWEGVVCAAPTSGSAGIVPGCLYSLRKAGFTMGMRLGGQPLAYVPWVGVLWCMATGGYKVQEQVLPCVSTARCTSFDDVEGVSVTVLSFQQCRHLGFHLSFLS
jgi:hypothetical protein